MILPLMTDDRDPLHLGWRHSFFLFLNKLQDLCIHFEVITTAQLFILFKIVGFIILVIFVAFWLLSFN